MSPDFKNILLIQLGDIGDVVLTTPAIRAIKHAYPDARLTVLVKKPFGNMLAAEPEIHEVVEAEKFGGSLWHKVAEYFRFARRLRRAHYDLAIDLRTGDRGAIFSFLTRAQVRVGCARTGGRAWQNWLFTKRIDRLVHAPPPVHPGADQSLRVLREIGIEAQDSTPRLHVARGDKVRVMALLAVGGITVSQKFVSINPCSRWKYKEWAYDKWGLLADGIWEKYKLATLIVGAPEDAAAASDIAKGREDHVYTFAGKTSLSELSALLSMSALHLGVDSAASHIAASVGTPTITLFGPGNWRGWTINEPRHRVVALAMPCQPCDKMGCDNSGQSECLDDLPAEAVMRCAEELLGSP